MKKDEEQCDGDVLKCLKMIPKCFFVVYFLKLKQLLTQEMSPNVGTRSKPAPEIVKDIETR